MIKKLFFVLVLLMAQYTFPNGNPILVTESTISLSHNQTEELYFSFAEGDVIEFDFEMVRGKDLREIEFYELPNNKLFSDFRVDKISKKQIHIRNKGLYKFRFHSTSLTNRVFRIKIVRIPANESTANFNTNWKWETVRDTIYIPHTMDSIAGYNTVNYKEKVRELVKEERVEDLLINRTERVHSFYNENRSRTFIRVDLPPQISTDLKEEKVIAWAYWIGVGEEAQQAYQENTRKMGELVNTFVSLYATPLAALAVGEITNLVLPQTGEYIYHAILPDQENALKFLNNEQYLIYNEGKGIAAYGKNAHITQGTFYIGLYNDNQFQGLDVDVKVVAIKESKLYAYKEYDRERQEPVIVTLNKKRMEVNETQVRVAVE